MSQLTSKPVAGRHFVAGRWLPPDGVHFHSQNPAHWGEKVGTFPTGTAADVAEAAAAARAAFPGWRRTSRIRRAELFDNLAQIVKREVDELAPLMARECGKVVSECRAE